MRVAIIDNDPKHCESLRHILAGESGMSAVEIFKSGEKALRVLDDTVHDIIILDLDLRNMSGDEFIKKLKAEMPKIDVLVYTARDDWKSVFSALKAGATGYLIRPTRPKDLVEAVTSIYEGGAPLSPKVARMVINELHEQDGAGAEGLSRKQTVVLREMDRGLTYREIANGLRISPHTVRTHIRNIYEKLEVKNKSEAVRRARKKGLI